MSKRANLSSILLLFCLAECFYVVFPDSDDSFAPESGAEDQDIREE